MRESRREQSTEAQEVELSASGAVRVFKHDRGESSRVADCPQWLACLDYRRATLAIRKVDRLVGSEVVAIQTIAELHDRGVQINGLTEPDIDRTTPIGRACSASSPFSRSCVSTRFGRIPGEASHMSALRAASEVGPR